MGYRNGWISAAIVVLAITAVLTAQDKKPASPPGEASVTFANGKYVTIQYSRPSMRGRKIFGGLVPYGQVWRTGANAATSMKTDVDLNIGGANIPAGSYTLYTIPGPDAWKLIINKQTGQWGTEYDQSQDLARVDMKVAQRSTPLEMFTIGLGKGGANTAALKLEWADVVASVDVKEGK